MIKVAFVNSTKKWGGVKTHTISFGEKLTESGHEVFIYARDDKFLEKSAASKFHVKKVKFSSSYSLFNIAFFLREFKCQKIDVLITNVGKDMTTAGIAARILGIPVVQHIGAHLDMRPKQKYRILHKLLNPIFFCSSVYIGEYFMKTIPWVDKSRVKVVLNGKIPTTTELKTHTPRRLVATQQLNPDKGHSTLLRAIASIPEHLEFHIVGTGPCEMELKQLADNLGLQSRVIWHGFTTNVEAILEESDIFLLASLMEGLPNTLLEALSSGLMPVCRSVAGNYEVWPDELQEYLLPYEADENVFAAAIRKSLALSDEELLAAKRQARKACEEKCNLNLLARQFEEWLVQLAER